MIKNEEQYNVSMSVLSSLMAGLLRAREMTSSSEVHPVLRKASIDGLQSMIDEIKSDTDEYARQKSLACRPLDRFTHHQMHWLCFKGWEAWECWQWVAAGQCWLRPGHSRPVEATDAHSQGWRYGAEAHPPAEEPQ